MNTDYTTKITEIFYSVDEFCKQIEPQFKKKAIGEDGKKRRNRAFKMSDSEIITILILFHPSGYRTLKAFYTQMICKEWRQHFPVVLSYNCFVEREHMVSLKLYLVHPTLGNFRESHGSHSRILFLTPKAFA